MDKPIPFFYYDILSRIIPGAFTLAALLSIFTELPNTPLINLLKGASGWIAVVIPIFLACICYLIGVVYEVFDYLPPIKYLVLGSDRKLFEVVWNEQSGRFPQQIKETVAAGTDAQRSAFRFGMWDKLVLRGAATPEGGSMFAHCHRYQAEHKMFLHLIYASWLFAGYSFFNCAPWLGLTDLCVIPLFLWICSRTRNRRRWLQVVIFSRELGIVEDCVRVCFDCVA